MTTHGILSAVSRLRWSHVLPRFVLKGFGHDLWNLDYRLTEASQTM